MFEAEQLHGGELIKMLPERYRNSGVDCFNLNSVSFCHLDDVGRLDTSALVFTF